MRQSNGRTRSWFLVALAGLALAAAGAGAANPGDVVINEVMYDSVSSTDEEWVELHNTTAEPIDIGSWVLTDDDTYPEMTSEGQLAVPSGAILPAGGYLVIAKTAMAELPSATVGAPFGTFTFGNTGDNLALFDTSGVLIDGSLTVEFPDLAPTNAGTSIEKIDESSGWSGDPGAWVPSVQAWGGMEHVFCSPGLANSAQGTPGPTVTPTPETTPPPIGDLVVNEYMANPQSDWDGDLALDESMDEWVELFNSGASPIDLTGISIGDNTNPTRYTFVSGTLDPDCWVVVYGGDIGPTGFGFNNSSADTVWLTAADGTTVLDQHSYSTATNDIAKRRLADGGATWGESPACAAPGGGPSCPNPNASNDGTVVCLTAPTATPTPEPTAVPTATPTSGTAHEVFIPFWQQGSGEQTFFSFYNAPGAATGLDLTLFLYDEAGQWLDSSPLVHLAPGQMYLPDTGNDPWYDSGSHFGGAIAMIDYDATPAASDLLSAWAAVYAVLPDSQPGFTVPVPQSPLAPASGTSAIGVGDGQVLIPYWEKRGSAVTFYALWNSPHSAHTADIWISLRDHSGAVVGSNQSVLAPGEVAFVETVPPFGPVSDMVGVGNIDIDFGPETDPGDQVVLWSTVYGIYGGTQVGFPVALELPDSPAHASAGRPTYAVQSPFWQVGLGLNTVWSFYNAPGGITVDLHLELADLNGNLLETSPVLTLAPGQGGILDTADVWYEAGWQVGVASIVLDYASAPSGLDVVAMWSAAYSDPQPGDARTGFTVSIPGAPAVPPALDGEAGRGSRQGEGTVLIPFWQEGLGVHTFWSIGNSPDSSETATVTLRLRDAGGTEIESAVNTLAPGQAWMTETWEGWYTAGDDFGAGEIEIDYPTPDDPANQVLLWEAVYGYFQGYQVGYPVELR